LPGWNLWFVLIALFFLTSVAMTTVAAGQFGAFEIIQRFNGLAQGTFFHAPCLEARHAVMYGCY